MIALIRVDSTATITPAGRNASAVAIADQWARVCRYWVTRNWNETYEPNSVIAPMFARVSAPGAEDAQRHQRVHAAALDH